MVNFTMELLNPKPHIFSPFSPTPSLSTLNNRTRFKFHKSPSIRPFPNCKISPITAHFGGPTKRRNSLRKKLTHDLQVPPNPPNIMEVSESNLDTNGSQQGGGLMGSTQKIDSVNLEDSNGLGESVMRNELDSWVEQYNKDIAFWGIGSNPIFTVFKDSSGNLERVLVDEDEILRRSGIEPLYFKEGRIGSEELGEVKSKIAHAKFLAKEMELGKDVVLRNSSVVKFVCKDENLGFVGRVRSMCVPPNLVPKVSRVGIGLICGFVCVWAVKELFRLGGGGERQVTKFEEEMMRRKIKARMAKERLQKGSVEVVEDPSLKESDEVMIERPRLDKEKVLDSIRKAKVGLNDELHLVSGGGGVRDAALTNMDAKIQEIQMMARRARKIERKEESNNKALEKDTAQKQVEDLKNVVKTNGVKKTENSGNKETENGDTRFTGEKGFQGSEDLGAGSSSSRGILEDDHDDDNSKKLEDTRESSQLPTSTNGAEVSSCQQRSLNKVAERRKPKIILSVREAREYHSKKDDQMSETNDVPGSITIENEGIINRTKSMSLNGVADSVLSTNVSEFHGLKENGYSSTNVNETNKVGSQIGLTQNGPSEPLSTEDLNMDVTPNLDASVMERDCLPTEQNLDIADTLDEKTNPSNLEDPSDNFPDNNACISTCKSSEATDSRSESADCDANLAEKAYTQAEKSLDKAGETIEMLKYSSVSGASVPIADGNDQHGLGSEKNTFTPNGLNGHVTARKIDEDGKVLTDQTQGENKEEGPLANENKWLEKNFHEVEPIVQKIGGGFRNNYMVAREKAKEEMDLGFDLMNLSMNDDTELEWMQDEKLREIVFMVRDNELSGRDPFDSMDPEDKVAFFKGLERKVEKQNEKLATLHEWLHSNIENVDYGADGISLYDPPEKVIPRWKGPPVDKIPEFLSNAAGQQQEASSFLQQKKDKESSKDDSKPMSGEASITKPRPKGKVTKTPKTVIEASDGSTKAGKKSGKEFWQHTKKLSPGFVESYNAESDPEVKSVMKDIGKDLDRWITEKEIQEAADVMDRIPQRAKEIVEKKLSKVRREMELFGPAAVVSKYSEYAEDKEEDYLWWLDLPYVLCIEMYTYEGEEQQVGFYSLEMATDLDIDPKPNHVIAFEDAGDCKNFCYIIQAHLEMLGKGQAFVVAQTPKDAFRQAKANGFGVTVIRKGELKLNIDQPLEEVEELITEIGSKMYHDKLMKGRSVDISALMKGVFGISHPSKGRRKKRALKKPKKP